MRFFEKLKISDGFKNIFKITSGSILGQGISLIAVPIYTRIYGASILGIWAIINSISTIITSFSDLGLKNAIMIECEEENTERLYAVISTITAIISVIVGLLFFFYYNYIDTSLGLNPIFTAVLISVTSFLAPQTQTSYTWLNKRGKYDVLMKNPVIHNLSMAIVSITLGLLGFVKYGYYIGIIVGSVITLLRMKFHLPRKLFTFNINDYLYVFKTKKEFYFFQMPTNVLGQFKEQIPVFAIKMFYGTEILGYYSIAVKYLKLPVNLLAQSIGRVYLKNASDLARNGKSIGEYTFKNVTIAMKLAILPMIAIYSIGDIACVFLFGADFYVAGNILRIVASNSLILFLLVSCQGMTVVLHKQKANMISSVFTILGYFLGISIGYYMTKNIYVSCAIMSIIYSIIQITFFAFLFNASGVKWYKFVIRSFVLFASSILAALIIRVVLLLLGIVTII